jgi:hypothetical protein
MYMPIALFTASVWPSVGGWNAELMSVDPEALNNDRQNAEVKTGS